MEELNSLREKIWEIDSGIVKLLKERMAVAKAIGEYKQENNLPLVDEDREQQVIEHILKLPHDPINSDTLKDLYQKIIETSRDIQRNILK